MPRYFRRYSNNKTRSQQKRMLVVLHCLVSVSYTHLDVYKRQNQDKPKYLDKMVTDNVK